MTDSIDEKNDLETTHFAAAMALGFGATGPEMGALKERVEDLFFAGQAEGGKATGAPRAIGQAVQELAKEYAAVAEKLEKGLLAGTLSPEDRRLACDAIAKAGLLRDAADHLQALKNYNAMRAKLRLRPVLWDFKRAYAATLLSWGGARIQHMSDAPPEDSPYYTKEAEVAARTSHYVAGELDLADMSDMVRTMAGTRIPLMNPDFRFIGFGKWPGRLPINDPDETINFLNADYGDSREPGPTATPLPTKVLANSTVAQPADWKEVENTVKVGERRIVYTVYPYPDELDAPFRYTTWDRGGSHIVDSDMSDPEILEQERYGVPVTVTFWEPGLKIEDAALTIRDARGATIACREYEPGDDRFGGYYVEKWPTVLYLPYRTDRDGEPQPLESKATYSATFTCKVGGEPFSLSWRFTTRAK